MDVVAIIAVRNDRPYLANCLAHLIRQGVVYAVVDNESSDDVASVLSARPFRDHLVDYVSLPFHGAFRLAEQLEVKDAMVSRLSPDWVIHYDVDEVMHPYTGFETLRELLIAADAAGCNAVNVDEFVFIPIEHDYIEASAGCQPMRHYYYYYERAPADHLRMRKVSAGFSFVPSGGHRIVSPDLRLFSESAALRHYVFRSQRHAYTKYVQRRFADDELEQCWHHDRVGVPAERFTFPPSTMLKRLLDPSERELDRSQPYRQHFWQWPSS